MSFLVGIFGGGKSKTTAPVAVSGLQIQSSTQGSPVQLVYGTTRVAPNLIWYGDFISIAQQSSAGSGGKGGVGGGGGGKGGGGSTSYIYQTAVLLGICEGPINGYGQVYVNKSDTTTSALGFTEFLGGYSQSPWGYLTTNHASQALNYHGIAYLAASAYQLGNSPQLPNHNFEIKGTYSYSLVGGTIPDADPSLVITDLLTNAHYGAAFPSARVGSMTAYQAYCIASGLWISPAYNQQAQGSTIIDDIATSTNSAAVWSGGLLNFIPYGDTSITANGYTYTAPSSPLYALSDKDFLPAGTGTGNSGSSTNNIDPLILSRKRPADQINSLKLECLDRNNDYNPAVIESKDQSLIDLYGLRQSPTKQTHLFADLNAGQLSAQLQLQRQGIRNIYQFTTDQRYILLDPMDIIEITDTTIGITNQWVRVTEITENDDFSLSFTCEEYLDGTGNAPLYAFQSGSAGYNANYNSAAGNANAPAIFEPPIQIAQTGGLEVDIACSGGTNWGGCDIYISTDGSTYKNAGRVTGSARQGVLFGSLAVGSDPDVTNTLSVDLTQSNGQLLSGSQADADNYHTLCYVDGEYISYETATLVSANKYNLTYLRRGAYGSTIASHSIGAKFARMDAGIFAYAYDKTQIGQTIYIKLVSYNIFGGGQQSIGSVSPTTYTIQGPPLPQQVQNFQVTQNGVPVVFTWTDLTVNDVGLRGYDIAYGAVGSTWANKLLLTEAARATEMTNADVPPGSLEFSIRARDIADRLGPESIVQYTVVNTNTLVFNAAQDPGWIGTCSGLVPHPSGVLVPDNLYTPSHYSTYADFDSMVADPVSSGYYIAPTLDGGYNSNLRVYNTQASTLGVGNTGAAATLQFSIDDWLDGNSDPNSFTNWTSGYVNFRYLRGKMTYSGITAGNVSVLTDFTILTDTAPAVQQSGTFTASAGGSTLTFPHPYHTAPFVTATAISGTGLYASIASVTATNCIIHVWDTTGTDVGGVVNWNSNGA